VARAVIVVNNRAPAGSGTEIDANHIAGPLVGVNNAPPPVNNGEPNAATSSRTPGARRGRSQPVCSRDEAPVGP